MTLYGRNMFPKFEAFRAVMIGCMSSTILPVRMNLRPFIFAPSGWQTLLQPCICSMRGKIYISPHGLQGFFTYHALLYFTGEARTAAGFIAQIRISIVCHIGEMDGMKTLHLGWESG